MASRSVFAIVLGTGVIAAVMASCGGTSDPVDDGDTPLPARVEAGIDAAADVTLDAPAPVGARPAADASGAPCDLTKPFGTPVAISELDTADEDILSDVSHDGLTLYLASNHLVTGVHLFYATRPSLTAPFGARTLLFPTGAYDDWGVSIRSDGLAAVLSSDRNGMNSQLYVATRASVAAPFGAPVLAANTNSPANEEGPRWSADGKTLYFDSTRTGNRDLYRSPVVSGALTPPVALAELNTPAVEAVPVLSADELTIYFLSTRAPSPDGDIYVATRATTAAPFANVQQVPNVNSPSLDVPGQISANGCALYMSSRRGTAKSDLFVARRAK